MTKEELERAAEELYHIVLSEGGSLAWNGLLFEIMQNQRDDVSFSSPFVYCEAAALLQSRGIVTDERREGSLYIVIVA